MLHAPAQRDAYEGDRSGQSGLSRYVACQVYGTWFHRCMVSCNTKLVSVSGRLPLKLTLNIQWTYSERNIEHTLNAVQKAANSSKSVQLMVIFRKNTQILNFFRFPPVRSFPQFSQCSMPGSLHVQCTFNVCSLSVHSERMVPVEPVVKNFAVCEGRRGKRNRFYFGFHLCSFVFATFAERTLCSGYCWWTKSCTTLFAP